MRGHPPLLAALLALGCATERPSRDWSATWARHPRTLVVGISKPTAAVAELTYRPWERPASIISEGISHLQDEPARRLIDQAGLIDPAGRMAERLGLAFANAHKLERQPSRPLPTSRWVRDYWGADLVIDVHTEQWGLKPLAPDQKHYGVWYLGTVELYDAKRKVLLASRACNTGPESTKNGPSWAQLTAEQGALLRREMDGVLGPCLDAFARELGVVTDGSPLFGQRPGPAADRGAPASQGQASVGDPAAPPAAKTEQR